MAETQTPTAQTLATQSGRLPMGEITLIGIMGTTAAPRALIRLPGGTIRRVQIGDRLRGRRVDAIDASRVLMSRNGRQSVLQMPHG